MFTSKIIGKVAKKNIQKGNLILKKSKVAIIFLLIMKIQLVGS